jgi:hypothetical protein
MLDDVIVYLEGDVLSVAYLSGEVSIEDYINTQLPSTTTKYKVIKHYELPRNQNIFFNAWELTDDSVIVNMPKARDIHRATLRQERAPRLTALDVAFMRALERGDTATSQEIAAQKQTLRDIPTHPAIEAAQTPEELIALTLDALLAL